MRMTTIQLADMMQKRKAQMTDLRSARSPLLRRLFCRLWCSKAERRGGERTAFSSLVAAKCKGCGCMRVLLPKPQQ